MCVVMSALPAWSWSASAPLQTSADLQGPVEGGWTGEEEDLEKVAVQTLAIDAGELMTTW